MLKYFTPRYNNDYQELKLRVDSLTAMLPKVDRKYKTSFERTDRERHIFRFNPNTIPLDSLMLLGFSHKQAMAIIHYRQHGGFSAKEQFMQLNIVSHHQHLSEYVMIEPPKESPPITKRLGIAQDTSSMSAPAIATIKVIELNSADTTALKTLHGIGSYLARSIVEYRNRLGGFVDMEQLCEIKYFNHDKLMRIQKHITLDTSKVIKIPLNKDGIELLRKHPYAGAYIARGVEMRIKFAGGKSILLSELIKDNIISAAQAQQLGKYTR
jgi:DNA uptake protein ComE-like DNA-binding protein